jgi:hypothetical protein
MTTTALERSTMIAVFADREQAERAIDDLRHAGYSYDQIRLVRRGSNSFIDNVKSMFSQTAATTSSPDDWMRVGIPEQDARNYQNEIDAGRSIVLLKSVDNPEQALGIMRRSGAYDIVTRLRTGEPGATQGAVNTNAQPGTYDPNAQPGAYNPNAQPRTYDPNAQPEAYNPNAQPQAPANNDLT